MRSRTFWGLTLGAVVAGLLVAGSASQEAASQATNTATTIKPGAEAQKAEAAAGPATAAKEPADQSGLADAPVQPISTGKSLPPNLKLTQPVLEVVRLAGSGLDESVLMAFVTNSMTPFNLGVDEIIYLNDIGLPGLVVAAMIQRDRALKELAASGLAAPLEPVPAATTNQFAPEPLPGGPYAPQLADSPVGAEMVPAPVLQPDYAAVEYEPPPAMAVEYSTYYDSLAPYGTWVDVGGWGPCWRPTVVITNPGWRPYCHGGRWVYSDCGWYWLSGYSWGWAPFHYGRWFQHSNWGWCWAPGSVWGPAWVGWRYGGGYCGWAPLPPAAGFGLGMGLTYHGRPARPDCGFGLGAGAYTFVNTSNFRDHHPHRHALPNREAARVFNQTAPSSRITGSNNRIVNHGIPSSRVADATRTDVRPVAIRPVTGPVARGTRGERFEGDGRTLAVYRPQFPTAAGGPIASGGPARSENRGGGSASAFAPATGTARPTPSTAAGVGSARLQPRAPQPAVSSPSGSLPNSGSAFSPRPPLSASPGASTRNTASRNAVAGTGPKKQAVAPSPAPAAVRSSPEPATISPQRNAPFTPVTPVTRRESSRSSAAGSGSTLTTINQTSPRPSTTLPARTEPSFRPTITQSAAPTIETPRSRPVSASRETSARPSVSARPQPLSPPGLTTPARPEQSRSASRVDQLPTRIEPQRQLVVRSSPTPAPMPRTTPTPNLSVPRSTPAPAATPAPSIRTPTPAPTRSAPAPAIAPTPRASTPSFSPAPTRSVSAPAASPAPRVQAAPSRPASSPASSTPSSSSSGGQGRSSSGPRGR